MKDPFKVLKGGFWVEDKRIVELYFERNESAIKETDLKYGAYCYAVSNNILHNNEDSEECVNETWVRAWNTIPPKKPQYLRMFLAKITRNISFNLYNSYNAKKRGCREIHLILEELSECIASESYVEDDCIAKELAQILRIFVKDLPEREGNIFLRRYFFSEPISVIAEKYCISENNATVILSRTRRKLKQLLINEGYFDE